VTIPTTLGNVMTVRITSGAILRMSYPLMLAGVGHTLVDATDVAILAHYGVTEAGAVALADALYEVLLVLVLGLAGGLQIMLARRAGQGSREGVGAVFAVGLRMMLVAALLVFLLVRLSARPVTDWLVSDPGVGAATHAFLRLIVLGVGFEALGFLFGALYVGLGRTRILMISTGVLVATNIVLDYVLVFGKLGFPELGIEGSALGSVVAEGASFLVLLGFALWRGDVRTYGLLRLRGWDKPLVRRITILSTPAALEALVETTRWFVLFLIVERMGEVPLAASNLVYCCYVVLVIPVEGISEALGSLVSRVLGEGRSTRVRALLLRSMSIGYAVSGPLALLALLAPEWILRVFTDEPGLVEASVAALRITGLALLLAPAGELLLAAVEGTGDTRGTLRIELVVSLLVLCHAWLAGLVLDQPLAIVWLFAPFGCALSSLLALHRLRSDVWRTLEV
jgi:MATE family, multidrug efflux pump